ncbi:hypothetical protein BG015_002092 [Linnemannia schmuckeri]|uniref:Uncharacterized protein n=1 Tax=Linnemannia schmuckeri TaxID=64567 RepID=A0A9P5S9C8_9FUNG|nr:hypothetical protein BG015_002092 [Linnemannia schmuckeri]
MTSGTTSWKHLLPTLFLALHLCLLCLSSFTDAQIFNGNNVVAAPTKANIITTDIIPTFITTEALKPTSTSSGSKNSTATGNSTLTPTATMTTTTIPPPVPIQPYTTWAPGSGPIPVASPLPLPTSPALFPQNISTCSTCYGMFPTLSRCNVVANSNTFPITPNTTYATLMPFLQCICTFKALDAYPYCVDCFAKTQQPTQLNVLQANHLINYIDAFRQLCGVTYNGNRIPGNSGGALEPSVSIKLSALLASLTGVLAMNFWVAL